MLEEHKSRFNARKLFETFLKAIDGSVAALQPIINNDYGHHRAAETHGDSNSVTTVKSCDSYVHQSTKLFQK